MSENSGSFSGPTFHLVPKEYWEAQPDGQDYLPEPMAAGRESFIHCTDGAGNVAATGNRYYIADRREYLVLVIEKSRVRAPLRYEDPRKIFPHIYGPLNRDAIVEIRPVPRDPDGTFFPPG